MVYWKLSNIQYSDKPGGVLDRYTAPMKCTVTLLRRAGMRLRPAELDPPIEGELSMYDWTTNNNFGRPVRCMEVKVQIGTLMQARGVLFEPELLALADGVMSLRGIELDTVDGRVIEHEQVWRVRPVWPGALP